MIRCQAAALFHDWVSNFTVALDLISISMTATNVVESASSSVMVVRRPLLMRDDVPPPFCGSDSSSIAVNPLFWPGRYRGFASACAADPSSGYAGLMHWSCCRLDGNCFPVDAILRSESRACEVDRLFDGSGVSAKDECRAPDGSRWVKSASKPS